MADNSFIKMSVFFAEDQITVSSGMIRSQGDKFIMMGEDFDLIPHQSAVDVVGYRQDGIVFMSGRVTLSTKSQINFDIVRLADKQERRMYLKVKVHLKTRLLRAFSMGRSRRSYAINEMIQVRDLSIGGIGFYSSSVFLKKQKVTINFNELKPGFTAVAEILRRETGPFRGGYRFKYGCRLLNISGEEERVLCEYVFRTQLKNRQQLLLHQEE